MISVRTASGTQCTEESGALAAPRTTLPASARSPQVFWIWLVSCTLTAVISCAPRRIGVVEGEWSGRACGELPCDRYHVLAGLELMEQADGALTGVLGTMSVSPVDIADGAIRMTGRRSGDSLILVAVECTVSGDSVLPSGFRGQFDRGRNKLVGEIWRTQPDSQRVSIELGREAVDETVAHDMVEARRRARGC